MMYEINYKNFPVKTSIHAEFWTADLYFFVLNKSYIIVQKLPKNFEFTYGHTCFCTPFRYAQTPISF